MAGTRRGRRARSVLGALSAGLALAVTLAGPTSAAAAGPGPAAPELADVPELPHMGGLALARGMVADGTLAALSDDELARRVAFLETALLVNDEEAVLDSPRDLEKLVELGVAVDLLGARGVDTPGLRRAALRASYMMHLLDDAYRTRSSVKAAIDGLPARVPADRRPLFEQLVAAVRGVGAIARAWFPGVLQEVLRDGGDDGATHNLRGLWLLREGRAREAADAFAQAFEHDARARYAVHLYDALVAAGEPALAEQVRRPLLAKAPALGPELARIAEARADQAATRAFDAAGGEASRAEATVQIARYRRVGRDGAALALAERLLGLDPEAPTVLVAAAELYVAEHTYGRLAELLKGAEARGLLGLRLREARVAGVVQARVDRALGQPAHPLADVDIGPDLAQLEALNATSGRRVRLVASLLEKIALAQGARRGDAGAVPAATLAAIRADVEAALTEAPGDPMLWKLGAAALVGADRPRDAMALLERGIKAVAAADGRALGALLARMEAGYGVREADAKLLRAAKARAEGVRDAPLVGAGPGDGAVWRTFRVVLDVTERAFRGKALAATEALVAMKALPGIDMDFDETDPDGRLAEAAAAATTGALAFVVDDGALAVHALKQVRRFAAGEVVAKLATGQAQLIAGDPQGAYELLAEAEGGDARPAVAFALQKALAWAATQLGDGATATEHLRKMLALWDVARAPDVAKAHGAAPVFLGDFHVGLVFEAERPLEASVVAAPVLLLVPDLPHDRGAIRGRVEALDKAAGAK